MTYDPEVCPLCGEPNACGQAIGSRSCWCFEITIPEEVLQRVPTDARDTACVCRACALGRRDGELLPAAVRELLKRR